MVSSITPARQRLSQAGDQTCKDGVRKHDGTLWNCSLSFQQETSSSCLSAFSSTGGAFWEDSRRLTHVNKHWPATPGNIMAVSVTIRFLKAHLTKGLVVVLYRSMVGEEAQQGEQSADGSKH